MPHAAPPSAASIVGWIAAAALGIMALAAIFDKAPQANDTDWSAPTGEARSFSNGETAYVTASALNARSSPADDGEVHDRLTRGDTVTILNRSGEWLQIERAGRKLWIAAKHVSAMQPVQTKSQGLMSSRSPEPSRPERIYASTPRHSYGGAKHCKRGQPCGNSCISWSKTCRK